jgi:ankyrin repeat protein
VRALLEREPALLDSPGVNALTPLHLACAYQHVALVEYLIARGADLLRRRGAAE